MFFCINKVSQWTNSQMPSMYEFTKPLHKRQDATQGQFFKLSTIGLKSEFSFFKTGCYNKVKELEEEEIDS